MADTLILMYHRVTELAADPWSLAVAPDSFAEHVEVIDSLYEVVPLRDALTRPARSDRARIIFTFDDGYADNLAAASMLAARGIAATYFLTAGQLGSTREFWWDELTRIFLESATLPERLDLNLGTSRLQLDLSEDEREPENLDDVTWRADQAPRTNRQRAYLRSWSVLSRLDHQQRERTLQALSEWADVSRETRPCMRTLTPEEVAALSVLNGAEIGAHTMTHTSLTSLSAARQQEEIVDSRLLLEELTHCPVASLAYPYGSYTAETIAIARRAGLRQACGTVGGPVRPGVSEFELPRVMVKNWDGAELEHRTIEMLGATPTNAKRGAAAQLRRWYRRSTG